MCAVKNNQLGGTDFDTPSARIRPTDLNDTFDSVVKIMEGNMTHSAQLGYEQVKSDSGWTNTDYLGADIFTSDDGVKDTVDTGSSTSLYEGGEDRYFLNQALLTPSGTTTSDTSGTSNAYYDITDYGFDNTTDLFDDDYSTSSTATLGYDGSQYVGYTTHLGKTFTETYVKTIRYKAFNTLGDVNWWDGTNLYIILETYDGSSWTTEASDTSGGGSVVSPDDISVDKIITLEKDIQGIRISIHSYGDADASERYGTMIHKFYELQYSTEYASSSTVETNTIINEKVPKSLVVYGKKDLPENTGITVDVSEDGGSTWDLTGKSLNTYIDTSSFTGSDLALKFNLSTTDTNVTPKLYGYGVSIIGQ